MSINADNKKKLGIVLEGGAMRGMYTAGVLDTFMTAGLMADLVVGVSAGALFGVNYLSGQKGRAIRYNKKFNSDRDYLGIRPLLREGNIVSTEYAYERVPHELDPFDDETYKNSPAKFYAVVTDIETGEGQYIHVKSVFDQMDVLRASGSMPLVSRPVEIDGHKYLDGAIADSIPYEWMMNQGVDKTIVILTRDASYRKKPMNRLMTNLYKKEYPLFAEGMANRHNLYNQQTDHLRELEEAGEVFVIRPSRPIKIGRTERDPEKLQKVYELGCRDAKRSLRKLKEYLIKKNI